MNSIIIHYILHTCKKLLHKYIHTHQTQYRKEIWKKKYRKLFQIQGPIPRNLILLLIVKCWLLQDFSFLILERVQISQGTVGVQFKLFYIKFILSIKLSKIILKSNRSLRTPFYFDSIWFSLERKFNVAVLAIIGKKEKCRKLFHFQGSQFLLLIWSFQFFDPWMSLMWNVPILQCKKCQSGYWAYFEEVK